MPDQARECLCAAAEMPARKLAVSCRARRQSASLGIPVVSKRLVIVAKPPTAQPQQQRQVMSECTRRDHVANPRLRRRVLGDDDPRDHLETLIPDRCTAEAGQDPLPGALHPFQLRPFQPGQSFWPIRAGRPRDHSRDRRPGCVLRKPERVKGDLAPLGNQRPERRGQSVHWRGGLVVEAKQRDVTRLVYATSSRRKPPVLDHRRPATDVTGAIRKAHIDRTLRRLPIARTLPSGFRHDVSAGHQQAAIEETARPAHSARCVV